METSSRLSSEESPSREVRRNFRDALRYWEPRRLLYNFVLAAVALSWLVATWPHFRPMLNASTFLILSVLALLFNICYCAAYVVDIPFQRSALRSIWCKRRWLLLLLGMILAFVFENYFIADEIYPFVR